MSEILFQYHKVHPTTWVYLSSLLTICLYFKFSRLWSVRNLDLIGLILLAPGLLMVAYGVEKDTRVIEQGGYVWLFSMSGIFMVRLLLDPMMVRRPLLEPNLSVGGMTFLGIALLVFLMANVINSRPTPEDLADAEAADRVWAGSSAEPSIGSKGGAENKGSAESKGAADHGPGYPLLYSVPNITTQLLFPDQLTEPTQQERDVRRDVVRTAVARTMAILAHLAVVIGMVLIGYRHFDNIKTGIAAATLYLLMPYTAQWTGHVDHVLPAALVIWAIEAYRRPFIAGLLMGTAISVLYPVFLLPLWLGFYWPRGLLRFSLGVVTAVAVLLVSLTFTSQPFWPQFQQLFGLSQRTFTGFWSFELLHPAYRAAVLAAFFALCGSLTLWPAQKNLGTLMSCSAAVMLGTQFWMAHSGGLYIAWYLPLMLLTIFRPNLEDRVAMTVLGEGWFVKRRLPPASSEQAA
jgi:hypothetical protein